jgi:hypothetical protein
METKGDFCNKIISNQEYLVFQNNAVPPLNQKTHTNLPKFCMNITTQYLKLYRDAQRELQTEKCV